MSDIPDFPMEDSRDRRFMPVPAYLGGRFHLAGEKWYGSNGRNAAKGLPHSILMVTLNNVETGQPLFGVRNAVSLLFTVDVKG